MKNQWLDLKQLREMPPPDYDYYPSGLTANPKRCAVCGKDAWHFIQRMPWLTGPPNSLYVCVTHVNYWQGIHKH